MTREEYDQLRSHGQYACPDCGSKDTHPCGGCGCPPTETGYGTKHINKWHHTCKAEEGSDIDPDYEAMRADLIPVDPD